MRPLSSILLVALIAVPCAARADGKLDAAKEHYQSGVAHYDNGRFEDAIRAFQEAFKRSQRPAILFNLARAETKLGNEVQAIAYLKRYVEAVPDAEDAVAVRAEITARERALEDSRGKTKAEREAMRARAQAQAADEARRRAEGRAGTPVPGAILLGVGSSLALGAIISAGIAQADSNTVSRAPGPVLFEGSYSAAESRGIVAGRAAIALGVVGGVLGAAGVGLLGWALAARKSDRPRVSARLLVTPVMGGLTVAGCF